MKWLLAYCFTAKQPLLALNTNELITLRNKSYLHIKTYHSCHTKKCSNCINITSISWLAMQWIRFFFVLFFCQLDGWIDQWRCFCLFSMNVAWKDQIRFYDCEKSNYDDSLNVYQDYRKSVGFCVVGSLFFFL